MAQCATIWSINGTRLSLGMTKCGAARSLSSPYWWGLQSRVRAGIAQTHTHTGQFQQTKLEWRVDLGVHTIDQLDCLFVGTT